MRNFTVKINKLTRVAAALSVFALLTLVPLITSLAQRRSKQTPPRVTGISSRKTAGGEVISLSADSALNGIQTWQDPNGNFHLILPGSGESPVRDAPGVKVRRVGNSLEIEVQAKRGANVTVQPRFNRLDLVVNGGIDTQKESAEPAAKASNTAGEADKRTASAASAERAPRSAKEAAPVNPFAMNPAPPVSFEKSGATTVANAVTSAQPAPPASSSSSAEANAPANGETNSSEVSQDASATETATTDKSISSYIFFSGWWVAALLIAGLAGLVVWRRQDKSGQEQMESGFAVADAPAPVNPAFVNSVVGDRRYQEDRRKNEKRGGRRKGEAVAKTPQPASPELLEPHAQMLEPRAPAVTLAPVAFFGAYRVDQEVSKLVLGQPHRMDVLTSRASDDRRAMEASLLKALRSPETDEDGRRKSRQALEEYGFLARQSATLLLGQDACERAAAARTLGEVGSATSLQFLLEGLYDSELIVRTQAVESIGALKLPSAIGALLDMARRYPDMPSSVVSSALNACSIDNLDFFDSVPSEPALLSSGSQEHFTAEITELEPSASVKDLPESSDDETLVDTLAHLQSGDAEARAAAAQTLALFRVVRSVSALKQMAASDEEPAVRAAAVASLGAIDHESVFTFVLVALADEARDVRAAAARALSRLSFDRADAYVRAIETASVEELAVAARACIKTGMAAQALDRLASDDRRQAYEAFSLLSVLAKANETAPILEAIEKHTEINVRLSAIQVMSLYGQPEAASQLRQLTIKEGMPEQICTALLEVIYKMDEMQPV
ncbi:MAG: HEAT repeat domain-containing protein [Pyrinomonadaceae bacterium]|nr:HEAT repeat domain-containing protein [Pyrinomonadaceae bacterium]